MQHSIEKWKSQLLGHTQFLATIKCIEKFSERDDQVDRKMLFCEALKSISFDHIFV